MELTSISSIKGKEKTARIKVALTRNELDQLNELYSALKPISPPLYHRRLKMSDVYRFVVMMLLKSNPSFPADEMDGMLGEHVRRNVILQQVDYDALNEMVAQMNTSRRFGAASAIRLFIKHYTPLMLKAIEESKEYDFLEMELKEK